MTEAFADPAAAAALLGRIRRHVDEGGPAGVMEVCGTHTVNIFRSGVREMLRGLVEIISGPGCPVCVTPTGHIDAAVELVRSGRVTLATFGDMVRVPGSRGSLADARSGGADVRVVYSPLDALRIAEDIAPRPVVFLAVGFETTQPAVAASLARAKSGKLDNFTIFPVHRLIPPALSALLSSDELSVDGLMLPGHVSVVIGCGAYEPVLTRRGVPGVVAGFEPLDILGALEMLLRMRSRGEVGVRNGYKRAVTDEGNEAARRAIDEVFEPADAVWRGLGAIPASGLRLRSAYSDFDAGRVHGISVRDVPDPPGCRCGDVLRGALPPPECGLFGVSCTPESPVGPCMVSSEGSCAAYYHWGMR